MLLSASLLQAPVIGAEPERLEPVDEAPRDADFLAFRNRLQSAVAARDVNAVLSIVHPDIKNTFGGDDGIEAFKRLWRLAEPDTERWQELGAVLKLGGSFEGPNTFVAPYVFSRWSGGDAFGSVAVIGSGVRVRSGPSAQSRIVELLSFAVLRLGDRGYRQEDWTSVVLPDGRRGFIATGLVRSPIDYRAYFVRDHGRWQMSMFIAGD